MCVLDDYLTADFNVTTTHYGDVVLAFTIVNTDTSVFRQYYIRFKRGGLELPWTEIDMAIPSYVDGKQISQFRWRRVHPFRP